MTPHRATSLGMFKSERAQKLGRALGIDIHQYCLLVRLFSTLSDRAEFMGVTAGLKKVLGVYVFGSLLLSLIVLGKPPLWGYLSFLIACSMFLVFMILFLDAANSIMNPDEASVLTHQPIWGSTYVAAKVSHMLIVVGAVIPSLNLLPAFAGLLLRESRWFYPLTHMLAAYLAGLFIAFFVCGFYGWLFRFIQPAKLKNAAMWIQLIAFLVMMNVSILFNIFRVKDESIIRTVSSSWMPWRWFAAVGLAGHAKYPGFSPWEAAAACLITIALIVFGLRGFRMDYLAAVSSLIQGGAASNIRFSRGSLLNKWLRKITGAPSGCGAFSFMWIMLRRDWNFRRLGVMAVLPFFLAPIGPVLASISKSPLVSGGFSIRDFSLMHLVPHCLGMTLSLTCSLISYTAEPKGASIFVGLPLGQLRPFVRGVYLSLWIPAAILHICLVGLCIWFWGAVPAVLFAVFSLALVSFYLAVALFLVDGFPFASTFKPSMANAQPMILFLGLIPILFFAVIQWIVFHNAFVVVAATIILTALACVAAHFSLSKLESRVRANLAILGFGPQQMFREVE